MMACFGVQAFFLNIAIYIAIQLASGLIYALAGVVKDGAYFETCVERRVSFALSQTWAPEVCRTSPSSWALSSAKYDSHTSIDWQQTHSQGGRYGKQRKCSASVTSAAQPQWLRLCDSSVYA